MSRQTSRKWRYVRVGPAGVFATVNVVSPRPKKLSTACISELVVALAGHCGLGAVEVAKVRGVWAIGVEEDGMRPRGLLMATHKEWYVATEWALESLVEGTLSMGQDTVLGVEDDYAAGLWFTLDVPRSVESVS